MPSTDVKTQADRLADIEIRYSVALATDLRDRAQTRRELLEMSNADLHGHVADVITHQQIAIEERREARTLTHTANTVDTIARKYRAERAA